MPTIPQKVLRGKCKKKMYNQLMETTIESERFFSKSTKCSKNFLSYNFHTSLKP